MILITGVPSELNGPSMVSNILQKQEFIADKVRNGELFEIERTWKQKHNPENDALQNFVIKCSLAIRNFIMNSNGGYIYVELSRLRVHDFVSPTQCYHCQRYGNHFASSCPDKNKPPICALCMGLHQTRDCRKNSANKCCNCFRDKLSDSAHSAPSKKCPSFLSARKALLNRLDFSENLPVPAAPPSSGQQQPKK